MAMRIARTPRQRDWLRLDPEARAGFLELARQLLAAGADYQTAVQVEQVRRDGFVYVITHPAFAGYVKVGRAFDPESRLNGYQTGCPRRAYQLDHAEYFADCHFAERELHARLADHRAEGEWFRLSVAEAADAINQLREII